MLHISPISHYVDTIKIVIHVTKKFTPKESTSPWRDYMYNDIKFPREQSWKESTFRDPGTPLFRLTGTRGFFSLQQAV